MDDLTDADLAELAATLRRLAAELQALSDGGAARAGTVDLDQAAVGRLSRMDAMQQQQMAAAEARRADVRVGQIARALRAIDDGTYGDCARCGEPIGVARLRARPETPFCVGCATTLDA